MGREETLGEESGTVKREGIWGLREREKEGEVVWKGNSGKGRRSMERIKGTLICKDDYGKRKETVVEREEEVREGRKGSIRRTRK